MCILSNSLFPKRAKEDIICYKVLDANMRSPVMGFQYDFKLYKANGTKALFIDTIKNLFERIKLIPLFFICKCRYKASICNEYSKGLLHSYETYGEAKINIEWFNLCSGGKYSVYKAVIPKGTYYYESADHLASRKLQIVKNLT